MNNNFIADGKIHILDDKFAYILVRSDNPLIEWNIEKLKLGFLVKYNDYLKENELMHGSFQFIETNIKSLAIKFDRFPEDKLMEAR